MHSVSNILTIWLDFDYFPLFTTETLLKKQRRNVSWIKLMRKFLPYVQQDATYMQNNSSGN